MKDQLALCFLLSFWVSLYPLEDSLAEGSTSVNLAVGTAGWNHLFGLLIERGIDQRYAESLLNDPRFPAYETVFFSVRPVEPRRLYRKHNTNSNQKNALKFFRANAPYFIAANKRFGVPKAIILSILQVESHCGKFVGKEPVVYRLARLAAVADSNSIAENIEYNRRKFGKVSEKEVGDRALWLERTFLPHLVAAIRLSGALNIHPLDLRGSAGGAIGMPQFLPGNVLAYGVDGNNNGKVNLLEPADAIFSVASFLKEHGWHSPKITDKEQTKVILKYNQSKAYVETVLEMSRALAKKIG